MLDKLAWESALHVDGGADERIRRKLMFRTVGNNKTNTSNVNIMRLDILESHRLRKRPFFIQILKAN